VTSFAPRSTRSYTEQTRLKSHPFEPDPEPPAPSHSASPSPKSKCTFYLDSSLVQQLRGALPTIQDPEGLNSMSHAVERAIRLYLEDLTAKYNDGSPFASLRAGLATKGRPARHQG
jgi:hypothetical protein